MKRRALAMLTVIACVIMMLSCATGRGAIGEGIYCFTDEKSNLQGIKNQKGDILIPAYAEEILSDGELIICFSPAGQGMIYKMNGEPLFYEEFDQIEDRGEILICQHCRDKYVYIYENKMRLGPLSPCHISFVNNAVILSSKYEVKVYNFNEAEIEEIMYKAPYGERQTFSWIGPDKRMLSGMVIGSHIYAIREETATCVNSDFNAMVCKTPQGEAYGEDNGDFWTFFTPSSKNYPAMLTDVPHKSWVIYNLQDGNDYLIISHGLKKKINLFNGKTFKTISWKEWRKLKKRIEKTGTIGKLQTGIIEDLELSK